MSGNSIGNIGNFSGGSSYSLENSSSKSILTSLTGYDEIDYNVNYEHSIPAPSFVISENGKIQVNVDNNKNGGTIMDGKFISTASQKLLPTMSKLFFDSKLVQNGFGKFCKTVGCKWSIPLEAVSVAAIGIIKGDDLGTIVGNSGKTFTQQFTKGWGNVLRTKLLAPNTLKILRKNIYALKDLSDDELITYLKGVNPKLFEKINKIDDFVKIDRNDLIKILIKEGSKGSKVFGASVAQLSSLGVVNVVFDMVGNLLSGIIVGEDSDKNGIITSDERGINVGWNKVSSNFGKSVYKGVVTSVFQVVGGIVGGKAGATVGAGVGATIANWSTQFFNSDEALLMAGCTTFAGALAGLAIITLCAIPGGVLVAGAIVLGCAIVGWLVGLAVDRAGVFS